MNGYLESLFSLKGQVAIVTGGGRGLGRGMAIALAGAGADVALVSRTEGELNDTVKEIRRNGGRADAFPADVSKAEEIPGLVQSIHAAKSRIDILVNNAGFIIRKSALDFTLKDWERQLDINLKAAYFMAQAVGKIMKEQGRGEDHQHGIPYRLHRPSECFRLWDLPGRGCLHDPLVSHRMGQIPHSRQRHCSRLFQDPTDGRSFRR